MPFAPHEIENKRFVVALRGYQTDEVDGFLRAVAADYRVALEQAEDKTAAEINELLARATDEAAGIREGAHAEARQIRAAAHAQANVAELRLAAQAQARAVRKAAEKEAEQIRREAAEIRDAALKEAEAAYAQIARRAEELRRLEAALWSRMHALEHTVVECRQALAHVSSFEPMTPALNRNGDAASTHTLPSVDELLYRVEAAASLGTETNVEVATADL